MTTTTESPVAMAAAEKASANPENEEKDANSDLTKNRGHSATTTKKSQVKSSPTKKRQTRTPGQQKRMDKFEHFFGLLLQYKSEFGQCDVPTENKHLAVGKYSGLGQWYDQKFSLSSMIRICVNASRTFFFQMFGYM